MPEPGEISVTRRHFIKAATLGIVSSLVPGCCIRRPLSPCIAVPSVSRPLLVIDSHCHISNGSDLQVEDFIHWIVSTEKGIPPSVAEAVGALLQGLAWTNAPSADDELRLLRQFEPCLDQPANDAAIRKHHDERFQAGRKALLQTKALRSVRQTRSAKSGNRLAAREPLNRIESPTADDVLAQMNDWLQAKTHEKYQNMREQAFRTARTRTVRPEATPANNKNDVQRAAAGGLDFVLENFQYRYTALQDYLSTYADAGNNNVDLMLTSMVDYDWWISKGHRPLTPLPKQVQVMAKISAISRGQAHGLVPFDPLREVAYWAGKSAEGCFHRAAVFSSLDLVKDAIENKGCVGVKLYPPMGFAAYCNAEFPPDFWQRDWLPAWMGLPVPSKQDKLKLPIGQRLDHALSSLYDWCCAENVPIMAHSHASYGAIAEFKALAAPKYWCEVLSRWPDLRISFGHLGGFSDESNTGQSSEPASMFIALMNEDKNKPGAHAYADSAYFAEVLAQDSHLRDKLLKALAVEGKPSLLSHRLMYGTDWDLLVNVGDVTAYLSNFISILQAADKKTDGHASERFFGSNAAEWVGLRKGIAARARLEDFYTRNGIDLQKNRPVWMQKLDG